MPDPTPQGASVNEEKLDNDGKLVANSETQERQLSPREEMLARIDEGYEAHVEQEIKNAEGEGLQPDGSTITPMHDEDEDPEKTAAELEVKPEPVIAEATKLEDFVSELEDGTPVMKMLVDGEEKLVPLKDVQAGQQKGVAVETRFRENSDWSEQLSNREKDLNEREQKLGTERNSPLPLPGVGDQGTRENDLDEAQSIVDNLLHGDPDDAVEALATVISSGRASSQTAASTDELVDATAKRVREDREQEDLQTSMIDGLTTFKEEHTDIYEDPDLYALANSKTNRIALDNPEWTPTAVMREAGKQVREKFMGQGPVIDLVDADLKNDRQARKDSLVPIPAKRTHVAEKPEAEKEETPADIMDEVRRGRGQSA